jgi:cell division protein FtsB
MRIGKRNLGEPIGRLDHPRRAEPVDRFDNQPRAETVDRVAVDRGLRSKVFGKPEDAPVPSPSRQPRGPHGIDPAWYARRPWKSAQARILPLVFLAGAAWIGLSLTFGTNGVVRLWELKAREKILHAKLESVTSDYDELQSELREPAPLALERSAREKFDLQRPGEIVYRFPRVPESSLPETADGDSSTGEGASTESAGGQPSPTGADGATSP